MADIVRLARLINALPRNVDLATNSLHVGSVKVGTTNPFDITKSKAGVLAFGRTLPTSIVDLQFGSREGTAVSFLLSDQFIGDLELKAFFSSTGGQSLPTDITISLCTDDAGVPGTVIASAVIADIPTEVMTLISAFVTGVTLESATLYWFVITGTFSAGNYLSVRSFEADALLITGSETPVLGAGIGGAVWSENPIAPQMQMLSGLIKIVDYTNAGSRLVVTDTYGMIPSDLLPVGGGGGGGTSTSSIIDATAGENLISGEVVYIKPSDGRMWKARADDIGTCTCIAGVVTSATVLAGDTVQIATSGKVFVKVSPSSSLGVGGRAYLSTSAYGATTGVAPVAVGQVIYVIGAALTVAGSTAEIILNPVLQYIVE